MKFIIVLTEKGKAIYKGGNIEVMKPMLIKFESQTERKAQFFFTNYITQNVGSAQLDNYKLIKLRGN